MEGAPSGAPPAPSTAQPHLPPSLLGHLLRDPPPGVPDPKDAPCCHGGQAAPPSPSAAQNSRAQTSALVFNGLFLLPGGESPSPALYRSLAALCQACWHLYLPPHPVNGGVYGCTSTYRVCGWLTGKQHLLLPGIASRPAVTVTLLVGGQIRPPEMWSRQWGAPGCARLWDAGDDALLSLD